MELIVTSAEGSPVVTLQGRLNITTAPEMQKAVEKKLAEGATSLVLDFTGVEYMASAGIRMLVATQKQVTKRGGSMIIKGVSPEVMDVIYMTGLAAVFTFEA